MAHFTFVIPLNRDDLFEAPTRNQYTVENVYNNRDIKIKLSVIYYTKGTTTKDLILNYLSGLPHWRSTARGWVYAWWGIRHHLFPHQWVSQVCFHRDEAARIQHRYEIHGESCSGQIGGWGQFQTMNVTDK